MKPFPKVVTRRMREVQLATSEHLDADLLGAFQERSLPARERAQLLEHFAICAHCREVLALSAPVETLPQTSTLPGYQTWFQWPVLRYGLASGLAVLVIVGGILYKYQRSTDRNPQPQASLTVATPQGSPTVAPESATGKAAAAPPETAPSRPKQTGRDRQLLSPSRVERAASAGTSPETATVQESANGEVASASADAVFSKAKEPANPASAQTGPAVSPQRVGPAGMMVYGARPRWRVSATGDLQRSFDVESWQTLKVGEGVVFRAVAVNNQDVWAGGQAGALFHSPDGGNSWFPVAPAANGTLLNSDVAAIAFPAAGKVELTTSNGQAWTSDDSGQTWRLQ
jgi:hypothetical protein